MIGIIILLFLCLTVLAGSYAALSANHFQIDEDPHDPFSFLFENVLK